MKSRFSLLFLLISIFLGIVAFTPKNEDPIDTLLSALSGWTTQHPQEKVYLHMDKPYYLVGDTIWFKGYVTSGGNHQLSSISGALYVDLMNEKDSLIRSVKLPLIAGMAIGDFSLAGDLAEGNYRIRAYTNWMRNAGEDYFFDKTFTVGSPFDVEPTVVADYQQETVDGVTVWTAILKYKDAGGKVMSRKEVNIQLLDSTRRLLNKKETTDDNGNIRIVFSEAQLKNLGNAYIRSVMELDDKKKISRDLPLKYRGKENDVQFFPEGGNLLNGALSRIAFKVVGVDGLGVATKGVVTDQDNNEVATFESLHAGMGSFVIKPESGKTYTAKLTFADGGTKTMALPKTSDDGFGLGVYQVNKDSILVRVYASANVLQKAQGSAQEINLVVHSGGETIFASPVNVTRAMTSIYLLKNKFPEGIAQFTLFDAANKPLNERISFVRREGQLQLTLSTEKKTYARREKVNMTLDSKNPEGKSVPGSFSVSVYNEDLFPVDERKETTILSSLLLSADLKGYIEQPNYYFSNIDRTVDEALDNLMMTQGYRRFVWKDLLAGGKSGTPAFKAEDMGVYISGKVTNLGNKPLPRANVMLMVVGTLEVKNAVTDSLGRFKFDGLLLKDSTRFAVQASNEKGGKNVMVIMDPASSVPVIGKNRNRPDMVTGVSKNMTAYFEQSKAQDSVLGEIAKRYRTQRLNEVEIRGKKKPESTASQGMFTISDMSANQSIRFDNGDKCATVRTCLQSKLRGVVFKSSEYTSAYPHTLRGQKMNFFLDGRRVESEEEIADILEGGALAPEDIVKINVVTTNQAMVSFLGGPALLIVTKTGYISRKEYKPHLANITPRGLSSARIFYKPKYDVPAQQSEMPDLRTTVYWNASVVTAADGAAKFDFFNGDGIGNYRVVVEGIDTEGNLARTVYRYAVE